MDWEKLIKIRMIYRRGNHKKWLINKYKKNHLIHLQIIKKIFKVMMIIINNKKINSKNILSKKILIIKITNISRCAKMQKNLTKKIWVIKINTIMFLQNNCILYQILKIYKDWIFQPKTYNIYKTLNSNLAIKLFSSNKKTNIRKLYLATKSIFLPITISNIK